MKKVIASDLEQILFFNRYFFFSGGGNSANICIRVCEGNVGHYLICLLKVFTPRQSPATGKPHTRHSHSRTRNLCCRHTEIEEEGVMYLPSVLLVIDNFVKVNLVLF